jgi:hypothetical protein
MIGLLLGIAGLIIAGLAFYAGKLLFLLSKQKKKQHVARTERIKSITQSIETISLAMKQQQCDLSEGAIRVCHLLEALPIQPLPNFHNKFPHIFSLFEAIRHFATHEARQALNKQERRKQDMEREEIESHHENNVLDELPHIMSFCVNLRT